MKYLSMLTICMTGVIGTYGSAEEIKWVSPGDSLVVQRIAYSAGNDAHQLGTYSIENSSDASRFSYIKEKHKNQDCLFTYSKSKDEVITSYKNFVQEALPFEAAKEYDPSGTPDKHYKLVLDALEAQNNVAVYSVTARHDDPNPESCNLFYFYIFRPDGTVINLAFDFAD